EGRLQSTRRDGRPCPCAAIDQGPPIRDRPDGRKSAVAAGEGREEETAMRSAHRKKLASDLWRVHEYLTCGDADERAWAIDEAERLLRDTVNILTALGLNTGTITVHGPPSGFPLPLF